MTSRIDQQMLFNQTALNLRAYRQELIASNIANADTPNYKARDIDFKKSLAGALGASGGSAVSLTRTSAGHLAAPGASGKGGDLLYRTEQQSSIDGNTVNMDLERAAFADNAIHIEALITFINLDLKNTMNAIQTP